MTKSEPKLEAYYSTGQYIVDQIKLTRAQKEFLSDLIDTHIEQTKEDMSEAYQELADSYKQLTDDLNETKSLWLVDKKELGRVREEKDKAKTDLLRATQSARCLELEVADYKRRLELLVVKRNLKGKVRKIILTFYSLGLISLGGYLPFGSGLDAPIGGLLFLSILTAILGGCLAAGSLIIFHEWYEWFKKEERN